MAEYTETLKNASRLYNIQQLRIIAPTTVIRVCDLPEKSRHPETKVEQPALKKGSVLYKKGATVPIPKINF